jgi:hypothetical protein
MKNIIAITVLISVGFVYLNAQELERLESSLPTLAQNIKINVLTPIFGYVNLSYECQIKPLKSLAFEVGIIGDGKNMFGEAKRGLILKMAYRKYANSYHKLSKFDNKRIFNAFYMSPQFVFVNYKKMNHYHYFDIEDEFPGYFVGNRDRFVYKAGLLLNIGLEVSAGNFVVDASSGLGVGAIFGDEEYYFQNGYGFINFIDFPLQPVASFSFLVGYKF